ncbi:MAG: toll/interleukin-1 receptor domain-containing protein [Nitrosospira sp.]
MLWASRLIRGLRARRLSATAVFGTAALLQYSVSALPIGGELGLGGPLVAPAGSELTLFGVDTAGPLLSYLGGELDVRFERARLAQPTFDTLRDLGVNASNNEGPIAWVTNGEGGIRSMLEIEQAALGDTPLSLTLRALSSVSARHAQLEVMARDAPLRITLGTPLDSIETGDTRKVLSIGPQRLNVPGALPLQIIVAANSSFRAGFSLHDESAATIDLGPLPLRAADAVGLSVQAIGVREEQRGTDTYTFFACAGASGELLWRGAGALMRGRCATNLALQVKALRVSPEQIEVDLADTGWAQKDGRILGDDLLARLRGNPAVAALLAVSNVGLAAWVLLAWLPGPRAQGARGGVFISYRRDDSAGHSGHLYDRLTSYFGPQRVFMDIDDIPPGADFASMIEARIDAADTVLVVIGKRWLTAADVQNRRRLDDSADFVRIEIATALARGKRIIPMLVAGATMPSTQELPEALAALSRRNAVVLTETYVNRDVDELIVTIEEPAVLPVA